MRGAPVAHHPGALLLQHGNLENGRAGDWGDESVSPRLAVLRTEAFAPCHTLRSVPRVRLFSHDQVSLILL